MIYSERLINFMKTCDEAALMELLHEHTKYVHECRDRHEEMARKAGMDYETFMRSMFKKFEEMDG